MASTPRVKDWETGVDYYAILKVASRASFEEIRKAFRRLVLECHPDKNPGRRKWSEKRIRELIAAYEVLSDEARREAYDRYRRTAGAERSTSEPFFFRKKGPGARALMILHLLLHDRVREAVQLLREMEQVHGEGYLPEYLDSRDYLDCLYLLAEHFLRERRYAEAAARLRAFYLHERGTRFPRHYLKEVVRQLKDLYLRKLPRVLDPEELLPHLGDAVMLGLTPQEDLLRLRKLAEAQALAGSLNAARRTLSQLRARDPQASGLRRIEALVAGRAAQVRT